MQTDFVYKKKKFYFLQENINTNDYLLTGNILEVNNTECDIEEYKYKFNTKMNLKDGSLFNEIIE